MRALPICFQRRQLRVSPLFFSHHPLPVLLTHIYYIFSWKKLTTFFAHHCHFYSFHSGVTPWSVSPRTFFLAVPLLLSTTVCKFAHSFFLRLSPPGGCHPGRSAPPQWRHCEFLTISCLFIAVYRFFSQRTRVEIRAARIQARIANDFVYLGISHVSRS